VNRPEKTLPASDVDLRSLEVADPGLHPPRPRMALNVGITGHRASVLPEGAGDPLARVLDEVFCNLGQAVQRLQHGSRDLFAPEPPILRLHTPLATGADQLAATSAHANGYNVRATLPFSVEVYRQDFAEGRERDEFSRQLAAADSFFVLSAERSSGQDAYVQVGRAVIAAADILIAVWDGGTGNGPGGTAHVVELALREGVPVVHIRVDLGSGAVGTPALLVGDDVMDATSEPLVDNLSYFELLRNTLEPHTVLESEQIGVYFREIENCTNWRFEHTLLLGAMGVKRPSWRPWRQASIGENILDHLANAPNGAAEPLTRAYAWANFLAIRYAQMFRSGHITNYVLSTLAVILALVGLIFPQSKVFLVMAELAVIGLLFLNTQAGTKGEWHRRWLQYRHLAESMRPLVYLKRTGLVSTPFRSDIIRGALNTKAGADWTRWYSAAIWRQMDNPTGMMDATAIQQLAESVVREQVLDQANYHRINAERMHRLDHRLHEIGSFLMGAVIASCVLYLAGYVLLHEWMKALAPLFIFLTAGLPAVGSAVFGMRGHGEHLLAASRSIQTAIALQGNAARLKQVNKLDSLALELETTAAIMLADLKEWTLAYRERSLEIPA
jgi:hypothetical protein